MSVARLAQRPQYFFNPKQVWRRLRRRQLAARDRVELAWGLPVSIRLGCHTGVDILNLGVYDVVVPEAISRLLDPGERSVDVGANIGQNASLMALVAGRAGHVTAFEPHPDLWDTLCENLRRWEPYDMAPLVLVHEGLSDREGRAVLYEPEEFPSNQGSASLERPPTIRRKVEIVLTTFDAAVADDTVIALAKLDVEGHEAAVIAGATKLLGRRGIRDLIFEDLGTQPGSTTTTLEARGYTVFALHGTFSRPSLVPWRTFLGKRRRGFSYNYLATLDPARALVRFRRPGWRCLRLRARRRDRSSLALSPVTTAPEHVVVEPTR